MQTLLWPTTLPMPSAPPGRPLRTPALPFDTPQLKGTRTTTRSSCPNLSPMRLQTFSMLSWVAKESEITHAPRNGPSIVATLSLGHEEGNYLRLVRRPAPGSLFAGSAGGGVRL